MEMVSKKKLKKRNVKLKAKLKMAENMLSVEVDNNSKIVKHIQENLIEKSEIPVIARDIIAYITERMQDDYANKEGVYLTEDGFIVLPRDYFEEVIVKELENHFTVGKPNLHLDPTFKPADGVVLPLANLGTCEGAPTDTSMLEIINQIGKERMDKVNAREELKGKSLKQVVTEMGLQDVPVGELFKDYQMKDYDLANELLDALQRVDANKKWKETVYPTQPYIDPSNQVLLVEDGKVATPAVPLHETSLEEALVKAGVHLSQRDFTYAVMDYINAPKKRNTSIAKIREMAQQLAEAVKNQEDLKVHPTEEVEVDQEKGIILTPDGKVLIATVLKRRPSFKPFEA